MRVCVWSELIKSSHRSRGRVNPRARGAVHNLGPRTYTVPFAQHTREAVAHATRGGEDGVRWTIVRDRTTYHAGAVAPPLYGHFERGGAKHQ